LRYLHLVGLSLDEIIPNKLILVAWYRLKELISLTRKSYEN